MLSVTTYLSTDVAAVPLLWILPLTCYLLSFVVAFAPTPILSTGSAVKLVPALVASLVFFMMQGGTLEIWFALPLHLTAFLAIATALHLQLARARPAADALTEFYVWMAAGGVIGGAFNAFVAPVAFTGVAEYPVGLVATCLLLVWTETRPPLTRADAWWPVAPRCRRIRTRLAGRARRSRSRRSGPRPSCRWSSSPSASRADACDSPWPSRRCSWPDT